MKDVQFEYIFKPFLLIFIFINLIQVVISDDFNYYSRSLDLDYTHSLSLLNGNIFIIHKNGVIVYNYDFTIPLYNYNFEGNPLIPNEIDNNFTSLIQCNNNKQYVLAIIYTKIYIFSSRGQYLFHISENLFSDYKTEFIYQYYSFIYYKSEGSIYYFIVSFINYQNKIKLIEFQININNKSFNKNKEVIINNINDIVSDSVSCQMINYQSSDHLSCFYVKNIDNSNQFMFSIFDIENNFSIKKSEPIALNENIGGNNFLIKTKYGKEKNIAFVSYIFPVSTSLMIFIFDFNSYQSSQLKWAVTCSTGTNIIDIYFIEYIEQFLYTCKDNIGFVLLKMTSDSIDNLEYSIDRIKDNDCQQIKYYDIIFLRYLGKFNVIANCLYNEKTTQIYDFPYSLLINDYSFPTDEPESSFIFETAIPETTIKQIETTIPITTIKQIETTIPITTIKQIETTTPITTIKQFETTIPITTIKKIETTTPATLVTTIISTNLIHKKSLVSTVISNPKITSIIYEKNCQLKCLYCDYERLDYCIKCNTNKGYYPSVVLVEDKYVQCYKDKIDYYFFNNDTKYYEPCYSTCKTCEYQGNEDVNNCTSCISNYIFRPDEINSSNCVIKCTYYFYISLGKYYCTENFQCPIFSNLLIKSRGQCIDDCKNDKVYKFKYNYECLKECPEDTINDDDNICQEDKNKCYLYRESLLNIDFTDLESINFNIYIKRYINGFEDTDFHVDYYQGHNFLITIYKTIYCLKELEIMSTIIDFGECYEKVQTKYNLEGISLIILIADLFENNELLNTLFYFFHPETGEILSIEDICNEVTITIEKSLENFPEIDKDQVKFFQGQNIDIFNKSDIFYNDLCCFFESPNGRDVPLKERLLLFYPNLTLCDESCINVGVNLTSMRAICECKLKAILNEAKDATKLVGLDFTNLIDSLSIDVVKCFKTVFQYKYFIHCYGGFISIFLIIIQSICVIISCKISMNKIRKTTLTLMVNYSHLLNQRKSLHSPPRKTFKKSKTIKIKNNFYNNT